MANTVDRGRKLVGFLLLPMVSALSPLVALPAVTSQFGATGWGAIAIGQSIGSAASVLVELGWGLTGPQKVARANPGGRRQTYVLALATKLLIAIPAAALAAVVAFWLSRDYPWEASLTAVGATMFGLSATWFFIGTHAPGKILLTDALPRVVIVVASAIGIHFGGPLALYGFGLLVPSLLAPLLGAFAIGARLTALDHFTSRRLWFIVRCQLMALGGRAASAAYMALPVTLVGIVAPGAVPVFASAERLQRMTLTVLQAAPNMLQGWVGQEPTFESRFRRSQRAMLLNAALGVFSGTSFAVLAPTAARLLFSNAVSIDYSISSLCGIMICVVCTSRATGGIALVTLRRINQITLSAVVGAGVGIPAILILSSVLGTPGAVLGEICAEVSVLVVQLFALRGGRSFARVAVS